MTVSLAGYTNAGKSTLLNTLTGADVLAQDKLFATLDTRTRRWQLPGWGPVLLSDTVGFIRDLPHHLVDSFKATLEETRQANLLLHVADASNPAVYEQIAAVYKVFEELGVLAKDTMLVLNKIDDAARPGPARRAAHPLPECHSDQCSQADRPGAIGRRGERGLEPQRFSTSTWNWASRMAGCWPGWPAKGDPVEAILRESGDCALPTAGKTRSADQSAEATIRRHVSDPSVSPLAAPGTCR